ncbi:hypothetical protein Fot_03897 [Forsythia ovata]|uniref:Uncharacterized protein n=1 Tax=Forsythia ovata TaxID=205694 RepID=A0ABD1XE32_9LAMI
MSTPVSVVVFKEPSRIGVDCYRLGEEELPSALVRPIQVSRSSGTIEHNGQTEVAEDKRQDKMFVEAFALGQEDGHGDDAGGDLQVTSTSSSSKHRLASSSLCPILQGKVPKAKPPHLCQRPLDQADCKSRDVHEWQGPEGESQQVNPQDRPPQYFSENLPHTRIEPALPEDFSPRHLKPYQLAYAPGGNLFFGALVTTERGSFYVKEREREKDTALADSFLLILLHVRVYILGKCWLKETPDLLSVHILSRSLLDWVFRVFAQWELLFVKTWGFKSEPYSKFYFAVERTLYG